MAEFLDMVTRWQEKYSSERDEGFLSQLWYRGVNKKFDTSSRVYRTDFTNRAEKLGLEAKKGEAKKGIEDKRLRLEREMLAQFQSAGATFLNRNNQADIYFTAQHFGMPTRLLDWSSNPLAGLFFACWDKSRRRRTASFTRWTLARLFPRMRYGSQRLRHGQPSGCTNP